MATVVMDKKKFIAFFEKQLSDDDVILMTEDAVNVTLAKKKNGKNVTMAFAADSFKEKDSVGDIGFEKIPVRGLAICTRSQCSEETLEMVDKLKS